ncbi:hypothetical protein [Streptomyces sp. NBC_01497]|uniref:hypothetical protein n=1 Tax=Streptomyces sp. NBC_01497 TaxID=2903885 RepID=UPI002E35D8EA|nr:hypothetical protein [Streptomyces sp. NBC_01497]
MLLAIGDVVRDASDMALGTVLGVVPDPDGLRVAVHIPGRPVRLIDPYDVQLVARRARSATPARRVVDLAVVLVVGLAVFAAVSYAQAAGAGWLVTLLSGLGAVTAVTVVARWCVRMSAPQRFRV